MFKCENCKTNDAASICSSCKKVGFVNSQIGRYCSRECQTSAFESHKAIHKIVQRGQRDATSRAGQETIAIALKESQLIGRLPELQDNVLSILMVGCREWVEGQFSYANLWRDLKRLQVYPDLERIDFVLCGPEVSNKATQEFEDGHYTLSQKEGNMESIFPSLDCSSFSLAVVPQPGLSDYLQSWTPPFRILVESGILTVTTGYSRLDRWTMDAIFDEIVLTTYFGANVVLKRTRNPAASHILADMSRGMAPHAFYILFQGSRSTLVATRREQKDGGETETETETEIAQPPPLLSYEEAIHQNRLLFLTWLADESILHEDNRYMGEVCLELAEGLQAGKVKIALSATHKQIENDLQQRAFQRMAANDSSDDEYNHELVQSVSENVQVKVSRGGNQFTFSRKN
mmetsp:Transcript_15703/g.26175  ORF Transcript_15703/g.26175 Transcript_15703/m.26175 type:complete len:403 (-) Transcript_15703:59-1267(-)